MKCNVCRDGSSVYQNRTGSWLERCRACGKVPDMSSLPNILEELRAGTERLRVDLALQTGGAPPSAKREPADILRELRADLGLEIGDAGCPTRAVVERLRKSPTVQRDTRRSVESAYRAAGSKRFQKGL